LSGLPLELFNDISDVDLESIDSDFLQDFVKELSRRADEGMADLVFVVARLLPDEHHARRRWSFSEYGEEHPRNALGRLRGRRL
jgi:hypothetical protein